MIALIALIVQAQPVEPKAISPQNWLTSGDFPADAARAGDTGVVSFEVAIDATGKPFSCKVMQPTAWPSFDKTACAAMVVRGRFEPAHDGAGAPIASSWRRSVNWGGNRQKALQQPIADIDVQLARMPKADRDTVEVLQIEGADGRVERCAVKRSSGAAGLDAYACRATAPLGASDPFRGPDGQPERALRVRVVRFSAS
jgi:TonB family protein